MQNSYVYNQIEADVSLAASPVLDAFHDSLSTKTLGMLAAVQDIVAQSDSTTRQNLNALQQTDSLLAAASSSLAVLQVSLTDSLIDSASVTNSIDSAKAYLYTLADSKQTLSAPLQQAYAAKLQQIIQQNDTINASLTIEQNQKSFNSIYFTTIAQGNNLSTAQLNTLYDIANQCPYYGGKFVLTARELYGQFFESATYDDDVLCANQQSRIASSDLENNPVVTVKPNPVKDKLTVIIDSREGDIKNINYQFSDLLGKIVLSGTGLVLSNDKSAEIDIAHLLPGAYNLQIKWKDEDNTNTVMKKIVVIR